MLKKIKHKKKILVPDYTETHESIKMSDRDINIKVIYDSIKYYLKQYKKTKEDHFFFYAFELVERIATINDLYGKYETRKCEFSKNIVDTLKGKIK